MITTARTPMAVSTAHIPTAVSTAPTPTAAIMVWDSTARIAPGIHPGTTGDITAIITSMTGMSTTEEGKDQAQCRPAGQAAALQAPRLLPEQCHQGEAPTLQPVRGPQPQAQSVHQLQGGQLPLSVVHRCLQQAREEPPPRVPAMLQPVQASRGDQLPVFLSTIQSTDHTLPLIITKG